VRKPASMEGFGGMGSLGPSGLAPPYPPPGSDGFAPVFAGDTLLSHRCKVFTLCGKTFGTFQRQDARHCKFFAEISLGT